VVANPVMEQEGLKLNTRNNFADFPAHLHDAAYDGVESIVYSMQRRTRLTYSFETLRDFKYSHHGLRV
jgi:hypothetical protein